MMCRGGGKGVGNKMKILNLLGCIIMWMPFSFAYTLDDVFKFPEWKTDYGWHYYMNERIRPYSVIIGPNETVLWIEWQAVAHRFDRMSYFASRNAYLEVGGIRLPYIGSRINGELQWTTDKNGYSEGWGWNNPEIGKSYFYNMVFRGSLPKSVRPLDEGSEVIRLVDPGHNGGRGYSFSDGFHILPDTSGALRYDGVSEMEYRQKFAEKSLPLEGIYESIGEKCWRVACVRQNDGTYRLVFLENGYHRYWSTGYVKAEMRPTAVPGLFKAKWWNQAFQVLNGVVIAFDGATMKVASSEVSLDNGTGEMIFLKMYPSASARVSVKDADVEIRDGTRFALK